MLTDERKKLTEPVESMTVFFGTLLVIALAASLVFVLLGAIGVHGFGTNNCVTQPGVQYGDSGWAAPAGIAAKPGNTLIIDGAVRACALHPGASESALFVVGELPAVLLWSSILLLLWLTIRAARRDGPFTLAVATRLRALGWVVLAGGLSAEIVHTLMTDLLLTTMLTLPDQFTNLIWEPIKAIVPGPALIGAALLTFARIVRHGAAMDDEIKGTV